MISMLGTTVFMINSNYPPRRHTARVAHELAHAYLHVDEETELVLHLDSEWRADDPREEEAELLADWLLYGIDPEQLTIPLSASPPDPA